MSTLEFSRFFAALSLLCWAGTVATMAVLGARNHVRLAAEAAIALRGSALWLAALVAVVCTAGSLYFSEVAGFVPCDLCWFQRICMYPLAPLLVIAAVRRDRGIWRYALPLATVGAAISAYHTQLQAFPTQASFCPTTVPCTIRYVWVFGFVSLPFMALAGFAFILTMLLAANVSRSDLERNDREQPARRQDEEGPAPTEATVPTELTS
jgi:disulfide bond formation protein DsbB